MRGVVFTGDKTLDFVSFDDPVPGPCEVVLEIKASGLCGSDLKFYRASKAGGFQALGFKGDGAPLIAAHVIDSSKDDPVEAIKALTSGLGALKSVDTTGVAAGRSAAVRCSAAWGVVALVGEGGQLTVDVSTEMIRKQLTLIGSWTFSTVGQEDCARFVASHKVAVDELFTERWDLEDAVQANQLFDTQSSGKAVFVM